MTEEEDSLPWLDLVELAWKEVASKNEITDIAFHFVPIKRRTEFTMDMLIEGTSLQINRFIFHKFSKRSALA